MPPALDNLPDEVILQIFHWLPHLNDVLRLRRVSRHLSGVGRSVLRQCCTTAYLYATPESIADFEALCQHPLYSQSITEVVYIGAQYDPKLCCINEYTNDRLIRKVRADFRLPNSLLRKQYDTYVDMYEKQRQVLERGEDVAALARNLPNLPRLKSLAYSPRPRNKGLNQPKFWQLAMSEEITLSEQSQAKWELVQDLPVRTLMEMELMRASLFRAFTPEFPPECRPFWALKDLPELQRKLTFCHRRTPVEITDNYTIQDLRIGPDLGKAVTWLTGVNLELWCERGSELNLPDRQLDGWIAMLKRATNIKNFRFSWHQRPLCALADAIMNQCYWPNLESATFSSVYLMQQEPTDWQYADEAPLLRAGSLMSFLDRHQGLKELKLWSRYTGFMTPMDENEFQGLLEYLRANFTHLNQATVVWEIPRLDRDAKMRDLEDRANVKDFTPLEYEHEVRQINAEIAEYTLHRTSHHRFELNNMSSRMRIKPHDLPPSPGGYYAPRIYDFGPVVTGKPSTAYRNPEVLFELF